MEGAVAESAAGKDEVVARAASLVWRLPPLAAGLAAGEGGTLVSSVSLALPIPEIEQAVHPRLLARTLMQSRSCEAPSS